MDPLVHKRYLDYRESFSYFGRNKVMMSMADFALADAEYRTLASKGEARDDEEEARFSELATLLLRD
jgi:hypothetical protein